MPLNSAGQWLAYNLSEPYNHQAHAGYAHTLAATTMFSINDRYIDPATGKQVSINAAPGDNTYVLDLSARRSSSASEASDASACLPSSSTCSAR